MVKRGEGLFYKPSDPPQTNDPYAIRQWCEREFTRIADAIYENRGIWVRVDVSKEKPDKPIEGMACYFAAGVVSVGSAKGFYEWNGTTWSKL